MRDVWDSRSCEHLTVKRREEILLRMANYIEKRSDGFEIAHFDDSSFGLHDWPFRPLTMGVSQYFISRDY